MIDTIMVKYKTIIPKSENKLLYQIRRSVEECCLCIDLMSDEQFCSSNIVHSSIGAHFRHIIDRTNCLINGIDAGFVDYDNRKRQTELEQCRDLCKKTLDQIGEFFKFFQVDRLGDGINVIETISIDFNPVTTISTIGREVVDTIIHIIHHLATIRLIMNDYGIEVDPSLGKAPSTIVYENNMLRRQCAQ